MGERSIPRCNGLRAREKRRRFFILDLLLINYEYPPIGGGAANAMWSLARACEEEGHRVTVLTAAYGELKGWRRENGVDVFRCRSIRKQRATSTILEMLAFVLSAALSLPGIVKRKNIDGIIVFFLFPCGPLGLIAHALFRIPYLISLRGGDVPGTEPGLLWFHRLLQPIRKLVYRKSAAIIANSRGLKRIAQRTDCVPIHVIPNGVDTDFFQPVAPGQKRAESAFQLIYVGRFQPEKNLCFLFHRLSEFGGQTAVPFLIHMVGEGPQKTELEKLAQTLMLSDRIVWHDWLERSALKEIYQHVDCLILPSRYEGMSNVILEAMACGLPILASRVGGNTDLVQEGHSGYLFDPDSPGSFFNAIAAMIDNPAKAKQMGVNARRFADRCLSWTQVARQYHAMILKSEPVATVVR